MFANNITLSYDLTYKIIDNLLKEVLKKLNVRFKLLVLLCWCSHPECARPLYFSGMINFGNYLIKNASGINDCNGSFISFSFVILH